MNQGPHGIGAGDALRLLSLGAIWGFSFIFMRVCTPELGPILTVEARVTIAAVLLIGVAAFRKTRLEFRRLWFPYVVTGALSNAIPYGLISAAELRLSASMAAILNATTPLFAALVAAIWIGEALTPKKVAGLTLSFLGVVILVGWSPLDHTPAVGWAIGASLTASLSYGVGAAYLKRHALSASPMGLAVGSQVAAALCVAPLTPLGWPSTPPSFRAVACVVALGIFCTGVALVLYYRLILDIGPSRALTVTFLPPAFAVVWGRLFLGEPITLVKVIACAVVLAGTALVTGFSRKPRLPAPEATVD